MRFDAHPMREEECPVLVMDREAETIMAERFGKDAVIALALSLIHI